MNMRESGTDALLEPDRARPDTGLLMTVAGFQELRSELDHLRSTEREEVCQRLRDARSYGAESDEVYALREEEAILEARIAVLEETLARAAIVRPDETSDGLVTVGCVVAVEDQASGKTSRYTISGAHEPFVSGRISAASPMGQALLGCAPGDVVQVALPRGRSKHVRVISADPLAADSKSSR